jgi:hypothetical protein
VQNAKTTNKTRTKTAKTERKRRKEEMEQDSKAVWIEKTRELLNEERDAEREESEALRVGLSICKQRTTN